MGLAAPWALLALAAVALPVIAHLLRRHDVPRRPLPTIALLHKADVASRKRVRVVDRALLAARIAVIALAALALAAPYASATLAWGDGRMASVAIVIDDSMSMSRTDGGGGTTLDLALERAREVIGALPAGSEVALVLAGDAPRVLLARSEELGLARARLGSVRSGGARGTALAAAIELAARQLSGARHPLRRVLVLSDLARHAEGASDVRGQRDVTIEVERVGPAEDAPNLAITDALAAPDPTVPGQLAIAIEVRAFGGASAERVALVMRRGGAEVARGEIAIAEGRGRTVLRVPSPSGGDPTAEIAIEDASDALPVDDRRGVLLRAASVPRVLLVDGDPQPLGRRRIGGGGEEARFLAQALSLAPRDGGGFAHRTVDVDAFLRDAIDDVDVVVLANVGLRRNRALTPRIEQHLARGGGLLVAAGDRVEPGEWSRAEALLPARVVARIDGDTVGLDRAAESALLPAGPTGLEAVRATRRLALEPITGADVALAWRDGAPALVMGREARVAVLGTTLDDAWSDLPYRPGFLPLAVRLVRALAPPGAMPDAPFAPGHAPELRAPRGATELSLIAPDGQVVSHDGAALARPIDLRDATTPGAWRVQTAGADGTLEEAPRSAFVVAPPISESDLAPGEDPADRASDPTATVERTATTTRRSLAPWAFALVGVLAVAEGALRLRRRHKRPA